MLLVRSYKFSQLLTLLNKITNSKRVAADFSLTGKTLTVWLFYFPEKLLIYVFPQLLKLLLVDFRLTTSYLHWKSKFLF